MLTITTSLYYTLIDNYAIIIEIVKSSIGKGVVCSSLYRYNHILNIIVRKKILHTSFCIYYTAITKGSS